jgi:parallel beta-helix repeat protein
MPLLFSIFAATVAALLSTAALAAEWHVSPSGNDAWSGSLAEPNAGRTDGPVATLERARDAIRERRKAGLAEPVTVFIHAGNYSLAKTFTLAKEDSGTAEAPVVWRAYGDDKPVLVGGAVITGWQSVTDDPRTGGKLLKADLATQGLDKATFSQLIFAGRRQHLARWPNFDPGNPYGGGWAYVDGKIMPMYADIEGESKRAFVQKPTDVRPWARPTEGEVFVFPRYNWWNNIVRIAEIDAASRKITLTADCSYAIRPGDRYFIQGMREELDAPGEWYHDRETHTLFFLPPEPLADRPVSVPTLGTIMSLGPDTEHVTIRGLTFECCEGTAVAAKNARHCRVAGCTIRNVGNYSGSGVSIEGGSDNAVMGCDISETGSNGISISGGDRTTLTPARNRAENNYIHHMGVFYKQGVGVALSGVGNRAAHNLIHDGPRMGIMFSGNNLEIEFNHVRHVNLETEDTGAIYTGGRDWISSRGSCIRHNFFHDILGYGREGQQWVSPHFAWGVYLDDNAGGVDVIGNIVARCSRAGLHLHNGRDNRIENNIFIDCGPQQIEYSGWTKDNTFWTNHFPTMVKGYESVAGEPAWQSMRNMKTHPKDAILPDGLVMTGNEFLRNIVDYRDPNAKLFSFRNLPFDHYKSDDNVVWHHGLPLLTGLRKPGQTETIDEWASWQALGFDGKSIVGDPLFVGRDQDDYRLRPESPALKLGFQPIPIEKIGPYADELRASWPIVEAEGAREKPLTPHVASMPRGVAQPADAPTLVTAVECRPRGGLPNFFAKAKAGGDVRVAYLGGSITAAPGWRVFSLDRLKKDFPNARFSEFNAAIGGTGSDLGAFRVGQDVIAHKPDLVFIEFAVNDAVAPPQQIMATMEGIVRQILRADPSTAICFVYTLSEPLLPDLAKGVFPRAASAMEAVADHYAIPSVHFGVEVNRRIADGSLVFKGAKPEKLDAAATPMLFSTDGVHPHVETGHRLYADVLARSLATIQAAATTAEPHRLPEPLRTDNWEKAKLIPIGQSMLRGDWKRVTPADDERAKSFASRMPVLWKAEKPGAELVVAFTGTRLGIYDLLGPGGGIVALQVDDAAAKNVPRIDGYCTYWRIGTLNTGNQPAGTHRVTLRLEASAPDKAKILFEHNRPDLEKNPAKYAENAWYASAILLLGDIIPADDATAK